MEKTKLNVLIANNTTPQDYIEFLNLGYDVNVISYKECSLKKMKPDLILFTGGEDVDPSFYMENRNEKTSCNPTRDKIESEIFSIFSNTPKLGICRGAQFLTVMNGGKLIQHVENHTTSHEIKVSRYGSYLSTSTHHQMMFPYNMKSEDYEVIGYSKYFRSNKYFGSTDANIELPSGFLELEIVYYPRYKSLCIQGHPEHNNATDDFKKLSLNLISDYLIHNKKN